jgi:RHS repeat-associated protein
MIRVNRPDDTLTRTYDLSGNVIKEEDAASKLEFGYDAAGRPTAANQTNKGANLTSGLTYEYDAVGNKTKMTLAANPTPLVWSYTYDSLNRQTSITNPQNKVFGFTYDTAGRMTKLSYPNGIDADASYDNAGQLLSIIDKRTADQVVVASTTYTYDNAGNRTSMTDWAGTHSYGYDNLHRLISAVHPAASNLPVLNETFNYDGVGNRTQDAVHTSYHYDAANRVQDNDAQLFTHDANGSLTSMTDKLSGHATSYAYNSEDRQKEVTLPSGARVITKYDAQGRRIEKALLESGQSVPAPENITRYVYDAEDILAMLDGNNQVLQIFTHGPGIDQPLSLRKADGTEYFIHADGLGSVIAHTDAAGVVVERVQYQAYGRPVFIDVRGPPPNTPSDHSLTGNPHAYTGREDDHETQSHHYRHRTYDYNRGAFFQEDPISFEGGINLYRYVEANPVNHVDPMGLDTYVCEQPLKVAPWAYGRGSPFFHRFLCVTDGKGGYVCGGQDRTESVLRSPGKPSSDTPPPNPAKACKGVDSSDCVDKCVIEKIQNPQRPNYGIPFGTDCQEWASDIVTTCQKTCKLEKDKPKKKRGK